MKTKYAIEITTRFKKDYKAILKRGYNVSLLEEPLSLLANGMKLPEKYLDHPLQGKYKGCREFHVTPDWLVIYEIVDKTLVLYLARTGTHSDLF